MLARPNLLDPLSLPPLANEIHTVLDETQSGGASTNDSFMHSSLPYSPFGGIGDSGTGSYRGKASFEAFSHRRSIARVPGWADRLLRARYMPYRDSEMRLLRALVAPRVHFDRDGRVVHGVGGWLVWLVKAVGLAAVVNWLVGVVPRVVDRVRQSG